MDNSYLLIEMTKMCGEMAKMNKQILGLLDIVERQAKLIADLQTQINWLKK